MNTTLPLLTIADKVNRQHERLQMLSELNRMVIDCMPHSTDSDKPLALLTGMKEIIATDCVEMYALFESLESMRVASDKVAQKGELGEIQ